MNLCASVLALSFATLSQSSTCAYLWNFILIILVSQTILDLRVGVSTTSKLIKFPALEALNIPTVPTLYSEEHILKWDLHATLSPPLRLSQFLSVVLDHYIFWLYEIIRALHSTKRAAFYGETVMGDVIIYSNLSFTIANHSSISTYLPFTQTKYYH